MAVLQLKSTLLIIGIAAGRKVIFRFFSPRIPEWLWILIGIRLLLPQSIGIPIVSSSHSWVPYPCDASASLLTKAAWIRTVGACAVFLILLANVLRFYGRMTHKELLEGSAVHGWIESHSCGPHYRIYASTAVTSPMVYGLLSPKIVLPAQQYDARQYEYILLHEWMHIRRGDLWKKVFMMTAVAVNWYNPACWLMLLLFNRDMELACDADVLRSLRKAEHMGYAHTLLDCYCRMSPSAIFETGFLSGMLKERIGAIMNQKKMSMKAKCCAVFMLGVLFLAVFGKVSVQAEIPEKVPVLIGKTLPEAEQLLQEKGYRYTWSVTDTR